MGALELLYLLIFSIVTGAVGSWLANELVSLSVPLSTWLIKKAAERLPKAHRAQYEAEWLQVILDYKSPTIKLLHAAHLRFRATQISRDIEGIEINRWRLLSVRALDIVSAVSGLMTFTPLLLTIAIAVKLSGHGPVFSRSRRVGRKGKEFYKIEFRTMDLSDYAFDYSRVTWIGRWLRRTSLDELPVLFNLLVGDVSLIGPPAPPPGAEANPLLSNYRPGIIIPPDVSVACKWNSEYGIAYWFKQLWRAVVSPFC